MIEVKFTLLDKADAQNDGQKLIAKEERYKVCDDIMIHRDLNSLKNLKKIKKV